MRKSKFTESQVVGILKEAESGVPVADLLRRHGISKTTFFKWRSKYAGASVADVKRLRELEGENAKQAEADVRRPGARERRHQRCPGPKTVTPSAKRQALDVLVAEHQLPIRRACQIVRLSRAAYYRPPVSSARRDAPVIAALMAIVAKHGRLGVLEVLRCRNSPLSKCLLDGEAYEPIPILVTDPHRPYTLWFVNTSGDGKLRLVIWPRKGIVHTVLKGDEQRWLGDFDTVEEAEEWATDWMGHSPLTLRH